MNQRNIENTLFLGNGFSRSIFKDMPSWSGLFEETDSPISNYTVLYEVYRLNEGKKGFREDEIKEKLIQRISDSFSLQSIKGEIRNLDQFGKYLSQHNVSNIITTNYDNGIEYILCQFCGYSERLSDGMVPERIYSVRTHKLLYNERTRHTVKLWKIHGDLDRLKSITLGFDQYCGALSKLMAYVKGTYQSSQSEGNIVCSIPMKEKCSRRDFDNLSWVELFFRTNIYIIGFGMDFSEIDIWWLLNKRARFILEVPEIDNRITYLFNRIYDNEEKKPALFAALKAFDVSWLPVESNANYISNIFSHIQ